MVQEQEIVSVLKTVQDPEFQVDVYNLGLIYEIEIQGSDAQIKMTLTTPTCPSAGPIIAEVKHKVKKLFPDGDVKVELTFEPAWKPSMMTRDGVRMLPSAMIDFLDFDLD